LIQTSQSITNPNFTGSYWLEEHNYDPGLISSAYIHIITLILDSKELLLPENSTIRNNLPVPMILITDDQCRDIRYSAFRLFENKEYDNAIEKLKILQLMKFEISGTNLHLARIHLITGNIAKAKRHVEIAWQNQENAAPYVVLRLLCFKILLCLIEPENIGNIPVLIRQLKFKMQINKGTVSWEMKPVFEFLKPRIDENNLAFLKLLITTLEFPKKISELDKFEIWRNSKIVLS
jgi:hypothetical protein